MNYLFSLAWFLPLFRSTQPFNQMITIKKTALVFGLLFLSIASHAEIFESLTQSVRNGDARQLSKYFGSNVELTITNQEDVYSKAQAEQIMLNFFSKYPPKSFSIIHQGVSKEGSKYAIGNFVSTQGISFRTYIYIKVSGTSETIQELRFEKE